jgi:mono/diheme cytochrome c family protein
MNPRFLLLAFALLGCGEPKRDPNQWPLSREELDRGSPRTSSAEVDYRRYCVGCHGFDGRGNGGTTGADLTAVDGPLTQSSDAQLLVSVRDGKRGKSATMPPHKPVLDDARIAALISYVRAEFQPAAADAGEP